jgi:hypothetical protein
MLTQEKIDAVIHACDAQSEGEITLKDYRVLGSKSGHGLMYELEGTTWWLCFVPHVIEAWGHEEKEPAEEAITIYFYEYAGRRYMKTVSIFSDGQESENKTQDASYGLSRLLAEKFVDEAYEVVTA